MAAMQRRRFMNPAQPQTLVIAVYLLYFDAAFLLFAMLVNGTFPPFFLALVAGGIAAGYGIANEFKWGYILGIVMAIAPFVFRFIDSGNPLAAVPVTFTATAGQIKTATVVTDANGEARTSFTTFGSNSSSASMIGVARVAIGASSPASACATARIPAAGANGSSPCRFTTMLSVAQP